MKKKDLIAMHAKSVEELKKEAIDLETEITKLRTELFNKKLKNTSLIKTKLDDLARVKTILNLKTIK